MDLKEAFKIRKKMQNQMKLSLLLVITWLLSKYFNRKKKLKK